MIQPHQSLKDEKVIDHGWPANVKREETETLEDRVNVFYILS